MPTRREREHQDLLRNHHHQQVNVTAPPARAPLRPSAARAPHTVVRPGPQVRDHIVFPSAPSDADWDVPAYQRRNGG
jgi:hypothetical protein